ncbi:hypothetical protein SD81_005885 [Tolypothrix campylonemoides VB511288]|nr:hypothetical protein SD81_005885 [Tolypothrix campylonemoides VB511288]
MHTLEKLLSALDALNTERAGIAREGWYLQNCWLVQVKPGGNARTDRKYWQARSRQAIFDGKMVKHLKPNEVDDYKAAIARGRQLKEIDRQIEKLQQQLEQLTATTDSSNGSLGSLSTRHETRVQIPMLPTDTLERSPFFAQKVSSTNLLPEASLPGNEAKLGSPKAPSLEGQPQSTVRFTDLTEQERLVKEVIAKSQALRASLRHSVAVGKLLGARIIDLRRGHPHDD